MRRPFGVGSAYGSLKRVLVHRPGVELDVVTHATLQEFNFSRPVDRERFLADYDAMLDCFARNGVDLVLLDEVLRDDRDALEYIARRPNMTYTRDLATVLSSGAVLMGPHLAGRRGDEAILGRAFKRLGVPVFGRVSTAGFLEGGGVTMIGNDTVVASLCDRADLAGVTYLRERTLGRDARYFLEVPLPPGHIHIDGIFMVLDEHVCLVYEPPFRERPCRLFEAGTVAPREVDFLDYLAERAIRRVPITLEERRRGHLNLVVVERGRRVVGFAEARRLRDVLADEGWIMDTFPSAELFAGNGGAHCMTCPLLVEDEGPHLGVPGASSRG